MTGRQHVCGGVATARLKSNCLAVTGNVQLAGTLNVVLAPGTDPSSFHPGDSWTIMTASSISGYFDDMPWNTILGNSDLPALPVNEAWVLNKVQNPTTGLYEVQLQIANLSLSANAISSTDISVLPMPQVA
jgi:hypothetical protein